MSRFGELTEVSFDEFLNTMFSESHAGGPPQVQRLVVLRPPDLMEKNCMECDRIADVRVFAMVFAIEDLAEFRWLNLCVEHFTKRATNHPRSISFQPVKPISTAGIEFFNNARITE